LTLVVVKVTTKIIVCCNVTPCHLVLSYQHFRGTSCIKLCILLFYPEAGGSTFLQSVSKQLPDQTESHAKDKNFQNYVHPTTFHVGPHTHTIKCHLKSEKFHAWNIRQHNILIITKFCMNNIRTTHILDEFKHQNYWIWVKKNDQIVVSLFLRIPHRTQVTFVSCNTNRIK